MNELINVIKNNKIFEDIEISLEGKKNIFVAIYSIMSCVFLLCMVVLIFPLIIRIISIIF